MPQSEAVSLEQHSSIDIVATQSPMKCDLFHIEKKQAKRRCGVTNGIHFNLCLLPKILPFTCLFLIPKNDSHFSEA